MIKFTTARGAEDVGLSDTYLRNADIVCRDAVTGIAANLDGGDLRAANLSDAKTRQKQGNNMKFFSVGSTPIYEDQTKTIKETLENAVAGDVDLSGATLIRANLEGADLEGAYLEDANLEGACLRGANLRDAELRYSDLQGADLRGADLRGADLADADLQGACIRNANLQGADLTAAV